MSRPTTYRDQITVTKPTTVSNEIGGWYNDYATPAWTFTEWARVTPVRSFKRLQYAQIGHTVSYELEMRPRLTNADIDCRVAYDGANFQIVSLEVDRDKVRLDIARIENE
jgi:hypothetical protein